MQAVCFNPDTDKFSFRAISEPVVTGKDVLVKVDYCGLNPVDAKIGLWKSMVPHMHENWVPGLDVSGEIVAIGNKVLHWKPGDRVLCHGDMTREFGGLAEYSVQDSETLIAHPEVAPEVAAATPCAGWTAWRAMKDKLAAQYHNSVLITGGSGGVGGFAIQLARFFGLSTIIATSSASNHPYLKQLGATHVIDYHNDNVNERVEQIMQGQGVSIGFDTVGPDNDIVVADALAFEGHMVELVDVVRPAAYRDVFMRGLSFHQLSLGAGHRNGSKGKMTLVRAGHAFSSLLEQGHIQVPRLEVLELKDAGDALVQMLKQRTVGKLVVKVSGD